MEFVFLEGALVALSVFEVLGALSVEHAVVPISLVLLVPALSVEHAPTTLDSVSELSLIPTAIAPPESSPAVAFPRFELALINVALLSRPIVDSPSLLLVKPELSDVVVSSGEIELPLSFQLSVVELTVDNFVSALEETNSLTVRTVHLGLPDVDYLSVLEKFGIVEAGLHAKHHRRTIFNSQQFFEPQLDGSQLATDKGSLVVEVVQVELRLLQHLLFRGFIDFQLAAHAADEKVKRFIHLLNRFEPASLDLFERILSE